MPTPTRMHVTFPAHFWTALTRALTAATYDHLRLPARVRSLTLSVVRGLTSAPFELRTVVPGSGRVAGAPKYAHCTSTGGLMASART
eukprot:4647405-Prymnesium_polylepis.1